LIARIANVGHQVRVALGGAETTQGQFDALTALTYNIGIGNLTTSTLLKLHIAGKYTNAAKEFGKWVKAAGKTMPGLVKRRAAETVLYAS
jgi:GH24 family phage-related lysozyme (muramidase)